MRWPGRQALAPWKPAAAAWAVVWMIVLWLSAPAQGQAAPAARVVPPTLVLADTSSPVRDPAAGLEWTDAAGTATLQQILAGAGAFQPVQPDRIHVLGAAGALWLHLRIARPAGSHTDWMAEIPLPPLDAVTLYQQDQDGSWRGQSAGDKLAVASWPEPGRFPVFRLEVPPGEARDVYFRIAHNARSTIPLRLATASKHAQRMQLAYLSLGLVFGGLLLVIAACLTQSWVYRDRVFFGYAAYAGSLALALAAYTGAGAHLLWPRSGTAGDLGQGVFAMLSAAAAVLFIRDLSGIAARAPRLASVALWTALGTPLLLLVYVVADRPFGTIALGIYLLLACGLNLAMGWRSWRAGDTVSLWILAAYLPLAAAVVLTLTRTFGLAPASWANQYGLVAAMAVQVPLLLVALSIHSRESHGATTRQLALSTQDALTGVLAAHLFHDRLRQLVARKPEGAAVLFVDLANYQRIREQHGSAVAEQSLLRSVIKLRRLLRERDTLSRIGESRFGVLLERTGSRVAVTDRAARVVAAGMMPMKGHKPPLSLQFHIAAALLDDLGMDAAELTAGLAALLQSMAPNTRRPIRFLGGSAAGDPAARDSRPQGDGTSSLPMQEGPAPV